MHLRLQAEHTTSLCKLFPRMKHPRPPRPSIAQYHCVHLTWPSTNLPWHRLPSVCFGTLPMEHLSSTSIRYRSVVIGGLHRLHGTGTTRTDGSSRTWSLVKHIKWWWRRFLAKSPVGQPVEMSLWVRIHFLNIVLIENSALVIIYNYTVSSFFVIFIEPLPVHDLRAVIDEKTGMVEVSWSPENSSTQDSYKLQYHEVETTIGGDSNTLTTDKTKVSILRFVKEKILPSFLLHIFPT